MPLDPSSEVCTPSFQLTYHVYILGRQLTDHELTLIRVHSNYHFPLLLFRGFKFSNNPAGPPFAAG